MDLKVKSSYAGTSVYPVSPSEAAGPGVGWPIWSSWAQLCHKKTSMRRKKRHIFLHKQSIALKLGIIVLSRSLMEKKMMGSQDSKSTPRTAGERMCEWHQMPSEVKQAKGWDGRSAKRRGSTCSNQDSTYGGSCLPDSRAGRRGWTGTCTEFVEEKRWGKEGMSCKHLSEWRGYSSRCFDQKHISI